MLVSMTRALLVIDVQESFRQAPLWATISNPAIASDVARLVDGARANGDLVVWVLHSEPGSGDTFDPASGHVRYIDPLKPQAGEPELTKTSHNAFTTTNLQQLLTQHGVSQVVVCGIRTEQCCETTARLASDFGYDVTFVTEATATNPIAHRDAPEDQPAEQLLADPRTLPASAIIERTEYALAGRFATIATIEEATALFDDAQGEQGRTAPLHQAGDLVPVDAPGINLGQRRRDAKAAQLGCSPLVQRRLVMLDCLVQIAGH
jgi:nicotinamidase-related amidase